MPDLGEGAHVDAQREGAVASAPTSHTHGHKQSAARVAPVVVEAVATKKKRNQADLSNGVTTATAAAASGARLHGWCPWPAG